MEENSRWKINFFADAVSKIELKMQQFLEKIIEILISSEAAELNRILNEMKSIKYSGQGYMESLEDSDENYRKVFDIGYLHALFDLADLYERSTNAEREIDKIRTGYRDEIFFYLSRRITLFHKELASLLQVSPSGLNAIIKLMNAEGVKTVNIEKVSKYTVYSLTPAAYQYALKRKICDYHQDKKLFGATVELLLKEDEEYRDQEKDVFGNNEQYIELKPTKTRKSADMIFDFARESNLRKGSVKHRSMMLDANEIQKTAIG